MIADKKRKYIHSQINGFEEIFDLENNPNKLCNLIDDPRGASVLAET